MTKAELKALFAHCSLLTETEFYALIDYIGTGSSTAVDIAVAGGVLTFSADMPFANITSTDGSQLTNIVVPSEGLYGMKNNTGYTIGARRGGIIQKSIIIENGQGVMFYGSETEINFLGSSQFEPVEYDDWYLPSYMELVEMYTNRVAIGGFVAGRYWSSTESILNKSLTIDFSSFSTLAKDKDELYNVRPIRDFSSKEIYNIGDEVGGGIIFYIETIGEANKYYVSATEDAPSTMIWGSVSIETGATGADIGTGAINSALIIIEDTTEDKAVDYCADYFPLIPLTEMKPTLQISAENLKEGGMTTTMQYVDTRDGFEYLCTYLFGILITKTQITL